MGPLGVAIPLPRRAARKRFAQIAQLVEQGTENPRVAGSIPAGGTIFPNSDPGGEAKCECSSSGRAPPCQGGGSEFEPRHSLHKKEVLQSDDFFFMPYKTIEAGHDT